MSSENFSTQAGVVSMSQESQLVLAEVAASQKAKAVQPKVNPAVEAALSNGLTDIGTPDTRSQPYDRYLVKTTYSQNVMKLAIPIGKGPTVDSGQGCRVAILGGPWGTKTVEWLVVRTGLAPALPAVEETSECQLMASEVVPFNDGVEGDMITRVYVRQGTYTYVLLSPPRPGVDSLPTPSLPTIVTPSRAVEPGDFVTNVAPVESSS